MRLFWSTNNAESKTQPRTEMENVCLISRILLTLYFNAVVHGTWSILMSSKIEGGLWVPRGLWCYVEKFGCVAVYDVKMTQLQFVKQNSLGAHLVQFLLWHYKIITKNRVKKKRIINKKCVLWPTDTSTSSTSAFSNLSRAGAHIWHDKNPTTHNQTKNVTKSLCHEKKNIF